MSEKKSFLLRLDRDLYDELRRWAEADLRSVNGQIEYVLRAWTQKRRGGEKGDKGSEAN
jgi:hypothetical protein